MEVRVMRSAETIITVIQERGRKRLPLERVYRLLYKRELYLKAYAKLSPNKGAMTKGSTQETVDEMSLRKIERIIEALRFERYKWTPARRVYIPKKKGKRPLGLPSWSDKLVQEVMRLILEAYYDPQFSDTSHGFRPQHGCHTALTSIQQTWKGSRWFIEGDIAKYFDTINHDVLLEILGRNINDGRFLRLLSELLKAGYMEDWRLNATLSGTPQGGVISPLLSKVYLNEFDHYMETTLIPEYTRGEHRKLYPPYTRVDSRIQKMRKKGKREGMKELLKQRRRLPSRDPNDPDYRRLRYVRYADDFLLGFAGPKSEAKEIKCKIKDWLRDHLKLTLSEEKTLITHAATDAARFLGYQVENQQENNQTTNGQRTINGQLGLRVPVDIVEKKCQKYLRNGNPIHRPELMLESDYSIVTRYQQEYRGIVQYYLLSYNVGSLGQLYWDMWRSLLKTLAAKHNVSGETIRAKYQTTTTTADGKHLKCLEVRVPREGKSPLVAQFGGISLARQPFAVINDQPFTHTNHRTEILKRLLADECELCRSTVNVEVHHVRKLADLIKKGRKDKPMWVKHMAAMQRKTLMVCQVCHVAIHNGTIDRRLAEMKISWNGLLASRVRGKRARTVLRGADAKVPSK